MSTDAPTYPNDLFTDEALADSATHYAALRDLGPVVWLDAHEMYVLPRYTEAQAALLDAATYCSGQGAGLNHVINELTAGKNLIATDGDLHAKLRKIVAHDLTPRALRHLTERVEGLAQDLVQRLVDRGTFDGVEDLARALPLVVVPDLVGWPDHGRDHLLDWASATFDLLGPMNERAQRAVPNAQAMLKFAAEIAASGDMMPGSVGAGVIKAAEDGLIAREQAGSLMVGYLAPSLDTTISAIGSAVWLLGNHPEQWEALKADPSLIPNAFEEVVRLESPIRTFSRVNTVDVDFDGVVVPEGSRLMVHFGAANRDERQFDNADGFDITRKNAGDHIGFGYGVHGCAGQGLARMEGQAVLRAMTQHIDAFEIGTPVQGLNNLINAWASLPMTVTPSKRPAATPVPA